MNAVVLLFLKDRFPCSLTISTPFVVMASALWHPIDADVPFVGEHPTHIYSLHFGHL